MDNEPAADRSPGALPDIASRPPRPWWAVWLLGLAAVVLVGAVVLGMTTAFYNRDSTHAYHGGRWHYARSASGAELTESDAARAWVIAGWLIPLTIGVGVVGLCLLIAGAVAWFRLQFSLRTLLLLVTACAILCSLIATLNRSPRRFPSGVQWFFQGDEVRALYSTYCEDELQYGFVTDRGASVTATNDRPDIPAPSGIEWWKNGPDGLWFNGKKVAVPAASRVFAILDDGRVVPIPLTDAEREILAGPFRDSTWSGEIKDPKLQEKLSAPFRKTDGKSEAEKPRPQ